MIDTSRRIKLTTSSGQLLHDVRLVAAVELDDYERRRLFGVDSPSHDLAICQCGWTCPADGLVASAVGHLHRDTNLPVHHVGGHTEIGSRSRNADSYGSAVDDTTGIAAFAVADGIGTRPAAAEAAAVAVTTALIAALSATDDRAVSAMMAAFDALALLDLIEDGDTVMVLAVSRPPRPNLGIAGTTWDIAWVGDCTGWLLADNLLTPLTTPHTHGQKLRDQGVAEIVAAGFDHMVLTSVGTADPTSIGTTTVHTETGRLMLASDGVAGKALTPTELHEVLSEITDPQECAQILAVFGADRPQADNATALVIDTHR